MKFTKYMGVSALIAATFLFSGCGNSSAGLNTAPVADAGVDKHIKTVTKVKLDGSHSSDADHDLLTYKWSIVSEPSGSNITLSDETSSHPHFTPPVDGVYEFSLVVNDGTTDSAPVTVTVEATYASQNAKPVADAGVDQHIKTGIRGTLDASNSSDKDHDQLTYLWSTTSIPTGSSATLLNATTSHPVFTPDVDGEYKFSLIVNDGTVDSAVATVTVYATTPAAHPTPAVNAIPVADAGTTQNVKTLSPHDTGLVTLDASNSSDADGNTLTYSWSIVSLPTGSTATLSDVAVVKPTFTADVDGHYVFKLIVNDGTVDSAEVQVAIEAATVNSVPVADAGADRDVDITSVVTLDGSNSSDADGDTLTYSWSVVSEPNGSSVVLSDTTVEKPTFDAQLTGYYVFKLIVNDGLADSSESTVYIGIMYSTVTSPVTGRVWLDRNLGAKNICNASNDSGCYGYLYQWGRGSDGHEKDIQSSIYRVSSDVDNPGTVFLLAPSPNNDWTSADDNGSLRSSNWSKTDGTSICPVGYRVPTADEINADTSNITDLTTAFSSFLKLPASGFRAFSDGQLNGEGNDGYLWSSSIVGPGSYSHHSKYFVFNSSSAFEFPGRRSIGAVVRCIKD